METTISDPNLRTDFNSVINYYFKTEISVLLSKLVESGQLTLQVESDEKTNKKDGETTLFYIGEEPIIAEIERERNANFRFYFLSNQWTDLDISFCNST